LKALKAFKAFTQLGPRQTFWYAVYQTRLRTGLLRRQTPATRQPNNPGLRCKPLLAAPKAGRGALTAVLDVSARVRLMTEAEEICKGEVRLFGGPPTALQLAPPGAALHWSDYERGHSAWGVDDIKYIWEPARFGWAFTLVRAYLLSSEERFVSEFWRRFELFDAANPPNIGPNWTSGQEVALRLLALLFASGMFADLPASTAERKTRLANSVAEHAMRIPPTLSYARAQHNNHLLSEALGLYAAGLCLQGHPEAATWLEVGWRELNVGLQEQIADDGTYAQHSVSYHRLMLHAALLADCLARREGRAWPEATLRKLAAAADWLAARLDPISGQCPNLGSNDSANILPLAPGDLNDYRSVTQAASLAFGGQALLPGGPWDELALWLNLNAPAPAVTPKEVPQSPLILGDKQDNWASLRAVQFTSRPSHADQLHVDIWRSGYPLALDAGTFRYSAQPPWGNALTGTQVHNTLTIDGLDQMTRAGKFLWLDWAQATMVQTNPGEVTAEHDGYRKLGLTHRRTLRQTPNGWQISDQVLGTGHEHNFTLHWLLPDWPFTLQGRKLTLSQPGAKIAFSLSLEAPGVEAGQALLHLIRAGESLLGAPSLSPLLGWYSPSYGQRRPALSVLLSLRARAPLTLVSVFSLTSDSAA
jgi:hypothetical protein